MTDAYTACLDFLYGRLNYERTGMPRSSDELRLSRMRRLLRRLGDPQDALRIVHVAGTKGKGSVSALIASALTAQGVRTGLFTSPHLHRLEERFRVDGREASAEELVELTEAVRPTVAALDERHAARGERGPTFFEVTTAMGLLHFARRATDAVVLEVGLGGRLDSTNTVRPQIGVITTISFDHTKQLGNTLDAIATEKAGILKRGMPAVIGVREHEPLAAIRRVAADRSSRLREIDRDFEVRFLPPATPLVRPNAGQVAVRTWARDWGTLDLPLFGIHQADNAAVSLAALDLLAEREPSLAVERRAVVEGWAKVRWPARVEVLGERPWLVIDGAHNVASVQALARTLRDCFPPAPRTLIFGTTRDKDLQGQLRAILPGSDVIIVTQYRENPRAVPVSEVADAVEALSGSRPHEAADPAMALELARRLTSPDGLICLTGSLFLAAETRAIVLGMGQDMAPSTEPAKR